MFKYLIKTYNMIEMINKVLKEENVTLIVNKKGIAGTLVDGYSVDFSFEGNVYTLELLENRNSEEVEYVGVYITNGSEYIATYIV